MHKALGRGLESLIPVPSVPAAAKGEAVMSVALEKIKPNRFQPRVNFNDEKLKELSESIKQHGLAQPLLVSPSVVPGEYEIIAGERRWRASKMAGLAEIPVIVKQADEKEKFQISLVENLQREDLNPIEEAKAFRRLSDEFGFTQEALSGALGKDRSVIANSMRLLNLSGEIQRAISEGRISSGHGRILAGIDDEAKQKSLADRIMREKLSVRETEQLAGVLKDPVQAAARKKAKKAVEAELAALAEELQRKLGTKVRISGKSAKGKIEIYYFSLKELERLSAALKGKKK
ncbi:MAG: ParB/RepB/Spo0J family partition protein [Endomicrobiales bacterium]|nr:ParB/RepB/Spo0J family partition protein [Endomicrobiales bacterium]